MFKCVKPEASLYCPPVDCLDDETVKYLEPEPSGIDFGLLEKPKPVEQTGRDRVERLNEGEANEELEQILGYRKKRQVHYGTEQHLDYDLIDEVGLPLSFENSIIQMNLISAFQRGCEA